ncbi:MAG TPA: cytochrome c biogenesis protein ResB [Burkholderiales bacterium]|jgi:cytochrome c biogenesis protein
MQTIPAQTAAAHRPRVALGRQFFEVISSMRFAVSMLAILAIASVIGTIVVQDQPYNNYINQFGRFWFVFYDTLSLYSVYHTWWFLTILAFLITSTSLCVYRNTPKMINDMRRYKENMRERAFFSLPHHAELAASPGAAARGEAYLRRAGFRTRTVAVEGGTMVAAKSGSLNRLGYVFAHVGMIVVCLGFLLDGDILLRAELALGKKQIVHGNPLLSEVPESGRMGLSNPSFRGNMLVPEGGTRETAILSQGDGLMLQALPFRLTLKKFIIEHYTTGQPKLFASDVTVTDKDTGKTFDARIEVNKPLHYRGVAVYQSSFDDGGSHLTLNGFFLGGPNNLNFKVQGDVGSTIPLNGEGADKAHALSLEITGFRAFNVEAVADKDAKDAAPKTLADRIRQHLGPGAAPGREKEVHNVGPSVQYKLRDAAGQAREYNNYMMPASIDGRWYLMSGMRENPDDQFRYLRFPMDAHGGLTEYMRLRAALFDPEIRIEAGKRFAAQMGGHLNNPALREQLAVSAARALEKFSQQGFQSLADFIEKSVPAAERERAADMFLSLLNGATFQVWQVAREKAGLPVLPANAGNGRFVQDSLNAISDSFFYGAPIYFHLNAFDEVQASVFQLTRSPGRNIVYIGALMLVAGVFSMLFIRERRLWLLVKDEDHENARGLIALSSQRRSLGLDDEFERHRAALAVALAPAGTPSTPTEGEADVPPPAASGPPAQT